MKHGTTMNKSSTTAVRVLASSACLAATLLSVGHGCNYVVNTTAVQCLSEKECLDRGDGFENTTCSPVTKTCIPIVQGEGLCTTNAECTNRNNGAASICRKSDKRCVVLQTAQCTTIHAKPTEIQDDKAIVIGLIDPANTSELGLIFNKAVQLAQEDLSDNTKGYPSVDGTEGTRPLVILSCNEFGEGIEGLQRAATHLAKNVQVPAVLGPLDSQNVLAAAGPIFLPNKVMMLPPTSVLSALNDLPNPIAPTPLIWRPAISDLAYANVNSAFLRDYLEQRTIDLGIRPAGEKLRVTLLVEGNNINRAVGRKLEQVLFFNGKSALDNVADNNFQSLDFGDVNDPANNPNPSVKISQTLNAIYQFKPHIVVQSSGILTLNKVFFPLERLWPATSGPKPIHLATSPTWLEDRLYKFIGADTSLQKRFFGTLAKPFQQSGDRIAQFQLRYKSRFPEFSASNINPLVYNVFDAAYLMIYAIAAVGNKPVTGENIAAGMLRLQGPGPLIPTGDPLQLAAGFDALAKGGNIDLDGFTGPLDFDPKQGGVDGDAQIMCPALTNGVAVGVDFAKYAFSASAKAGGYFDGATKPNCPE